MSEWTPTDDEAASMFITGWCCDTNPETARTEPASAWSCWLAAHDREVREQIEQQMIERSYFHIAWEKGLTLIPAGRGRAKVPPHWVEAATARVAPYLDIVRGEGE